MRGNVSTYAEKLKDPRWQRKRLEVFERAGWMCQLCGASTQQLHVHHPKYVRGKQPWDYENLISLCHACHEGVHGKTEPAPYVDPLPFMIRRDAARGDPRAISLLHLTKS